MAIVCTVGWANYLIDGVVARAEVKLRNEGSNHLRACRSAMRWQAEAAFCACVSPPENSIGEWSIHPGRSTVARDK